MPHRAAAHTLCVASPAVIRALVKQMGVRRVPLFHRLNGRLAFEGWQGNLVVVPINAVQQGFFQILLRV